MLQKEAPVVLAVGLYFIKLVPCVFKWNFKILWCAKGQTKLYNQNTVNNWSLSIDISSCHWFLVGEGKHFFKLSDKCDQPFVIPVFSELEVFQFWFNNVTFGVLPNNDFSCTGLPTDQLKWKCIFSNYVSSPSFILARAATQNVKLSLHGSWSLCNIKVSQSHFLNHVKDSQDRSVVCSCIQSEGKHLNIPAWYFHLNLITVK